MKLAGQDNQEIAEVNIREGGEWDIFTASVKEDMTAVQDLIVQLKSGDGVEADWVQFEE